MHQPEHAPCRSTTHHIDGYAACDESDESDEANNRGNRWNRSTPQTPNPTHYAAPSVLRYSARPSAQQPLLPHGPPPPRPHADPWTSRETTTSRIELTITMISTLFVPLSNLIAVYNPDLTRTERAGVYLFPQPIILLAAYAAHRLYHRLHDARLRQARWRAARQHAHEGELPLADPTASIRLALAACLLGSTFAAACILLPRTDPLRPIAQILCIVTVIMFMISSYSAFQYLGDPYSSDVPRPTT